MAGPPPEVRIFEHDQPRVYEAALEAIEESGFSLQKGGAAQGRIEAVSPISTETASGRPRQDILRMAFRRTRLDQTEVSAWLTSVKEERIGQDPSLRMGVRTHTAQSADVIFRRMEAILEDGPEENAQQVESPARGPR